jgi:tetratricopeptide (TPR) repeat protein
MLMNSPNRVATPTQRLYKRALAIYEQALQYEQEANKYKQEVKLVQHVLAVTLNNLAELYVKQGRYADAEPLHKRSLAIKEKALGPNDPAVATSLQNLAGLYYKQRRYADAESLYKRSIVIREKTLGAQDPRVTNALNDLAGLYKDQGRYAEAEQLFRRTLGIDEKALGPVSIGRYQPVSADRTPIIPVTFPRNARLRRLLPRLQTKSKLSLPLRSQPPRTMVSICSRVVVRSVSLIGEELRFLSGAYRMQSSAILRNASHR